MPATSSAKDLEIHEDLRLRKIIKQKGGTMKKLAKLFIATIVGLLFFGLAYAQFAKPEAAIEYRQSVMTIMGHHMGQMGAMVMGKKPYEKQAFVRDATIVKMLATMPWQAFMTPGSDKGKTALKPSAFREKNKFMAKAKALEIETGKLLKAANSGDINAIKAQFGNVGKSCKSCHDDFRSK
jgi:cytochrome c556